MSVFRAVIALPEIGNVAAETVIALRDRLATSFLLREPMRDARAPYDALANSSIVPIFSRDSRNNADAWEPSHLVDAQRGLVVQEGLAN